jgi:hypothetical protein
MGYSRPGTLEDEILQKSEEMRLLSWFRMHQFQTPAQKRYVQMRFLAERFVFWGVEEGVKTYLMAPI